MSAFDEFHFLKLPQELQNKIAFFAIEDVLNQTTGPVELKIADEPWQTAIYPYFSDAAGRFTRVTSPSTPDGSVIGPEATLQTAHKKEPALIGFALFHLCTHTRLSMQTTSGFWIALSRRLVFSDTVAMTRLAPSFGPFLREITLLKRFQAGQYLSVNASKPPWQKNGGNSRCLFRSIQVLRTCPSLERINIYLSIHNCQWQFSIAETLLPARQILGTQAIIHVEVKHCSRCEPNLNAFGVQDAPFAHAAIDSHWLRDKEYWQWRSPAGSIQWHVTRCVITDSGRERRYGLLELLDTYEDHRERHGRDIALQRLTNVGAVLRQQRCFSCGQSCTQVPLDLRFSHPFWCRDCGSHLTCGDLTCVRVHRSADSDGRITIIGPNVLTFSHLSFRPPQIEQGKFLELTANGPWIAHRYGSGYEHLFNRIWMGRMSQSSSWIEGVIRHDIFGNVHTAYQAPALGIGVDKMDMQLGVSEEEVTLDKLDWQRGLDEDNPSLLYEEMISGGPRPGTMTEEEISAWWSGVESATPLKGREVQNSGQLPERLA